MKKHNAMDLLFETALRHLHVAEEHVLKELGVMNDAALSDPLKAALQHHIEETIDQLKRLDRIFKILKIDSNSSKLHGLPTLREQGKELIKTVIDLNFTDRSKGMDGILSEGKELLRHFATTEVCTAALVGAGIKVENFEIACYQFVHGLACYYGNEEICDLLQLSLKEEQAMEKKLLKIMQAEFAPCTELEPAKKREKRSAEVKRRHAA